MLLLSSCPSELAIPVDSTGEVHRRGNRHEAGNGTDQKGVVFKTQQHIDEGVKEAENKEKRGSLEGDSRRSIQHSQIEE